MTRLLATMRVDLSPYAGPWPPPGPSAAHVTRILMVIGFPAIVATEGLGDVNRLPSSFGTPSLWSLALLALLLISGVCSTLAVVSLATPATSPLATSRLDFAARALSKAMLLIFLALLLASCFVEIATPSASGETSSFLYKFLSYTMVATVIATPVLPPPRTVAFILLINLLSVGAIARATGTLDIRTIGEPALHFLFDLMVFAALTWLICRADDLDRATTEVLDQELAMAEADALEAARHRGDSYVHDIILSVLTPAANGVEGSKRLRQTAQQALETLDSLLPTQAPQTVNALFETLSATTRNLGESIDVSLHADRQSSELVLDTIAADALISASTEAITNSLKHARRGDGRPVERAMTVFATPDSVTVVITDNGTVKDCLLKPGHGIQVSILQRMIDAGGRARVTANPSGAFEDLVDGNTHQPTHSGVTVELNWTDPSHSSVSPDTGVHTASLGRSCESAFVRGIGICAVVVHALLLIGALPQYSEVAGPLAGLVIQATATFLALKSYPHADLPPWVLWFVTASVGVGNLLVLFAIAEPGWPDLSSWTLGSGGALCVLLLARSGAAAAWGAFAVLTVSTLTWALTAGGGFRVGIIMLAGQLIPLGFYTVILWWARLTLAKVVSAQREAQRLETTRIKIEASRAELSRRVRSIEHSSRPLLLAIIEHGELNHASRREATVVEAELRDEIRAPRLCTKPLVGAARCARKRGVDVILLDDRSGPPLSATNLARLQQAAIRILQNSDDGRVVIRLLPPGRPSLATVVGPHDEWSLPATSHR